jgi:hypothetical protein
MTRRAYFGTLESLERGIRINPLVIGHSMERERVINLNKFAIRFAIWQKYTIFAFVFRK